MNEQGMRFRIGVFTLASMILLAVLVMLFGSVPTFLVAQDRYYVLFDQATGVSPGTPVRRSGVRIGQVQRVELDDKTGKVRITILIDRPHVLYRDDQAVLVHGALSGDTSIDFVPPGQQAAPPAETPAGSPPAVTSPPSQGADAGAIRRAGYEVAQPPPARVPAAPGTQFQGQTQADVAGLMNELSRLAPPVQDAMLEMRRTLERYERLTPLMEETMREYRDVGRVLREMAPDLRRTNDEVRELAKASRESIPELRRTNDEILVLARNWSRLGERLDVFVQTNQDKLVNTVDRLNDTLARLGSVFSDENQRNLTTTLRNVSNSSKRLDSITQNTDQFVQESRQTVKRVNDSVTQADQVLANLQQATRPMAERSDTVMRNLDESTAKLNRTLTDAQEFFRTLNRSEGTFRRFLDDPALYNNLAEAACMIVRIMPRLDRVLRDVEVFADKIARHPETLGVGGAISPSSGLKESPFSQQPSWVRPVGH
jgi:phospholipid/cholesterol/gamma-HCH transport system substrate-binding protein